MSEEEIIDNIKFVIGDLIADRYNVNFVNSIKGLLDLYQKEKNKELEKEYERVRAGRNWLSEHISAQIATPELFDKIVEENYISKDKIREKIQEISNGTYDAKIILQQLLKEE